MLISELDRVRSEEVSEAELREAKNEIFASALSQRQTAQGRAFELGEALVSTGDPDAADKRLTAIAAVTAQDVLRAAQTWLKPEAKVSLTYTAGEDNPEAYANPVPMPEFSSVPPASGEPRSVLPEEERMAPPPPIDAPEVVRAEFVEETLPNGIPLVTAQTSDVPIATMTIVFPGGDATDPAAKAGLAGLAASIADKGTSNRSATEIAATLESLGANLGFSTNEDGTYVSLTAPTVNLAEAGEVLVDVIKNADYPAEELERERKRALDKSRSEFQGSRFAGWSGGDASLLWRSALRSCQQSILYPADHARRPNRASGKLLEFQHSEDRHQRRYLRRSGQCAGGRSVG